MVRLSQFSILQEPGAPAFDIAAGDDESDIALSKGELTN